MSIKALKVTQGTDPNDRKSPTGLLQLVGWDLMVLLTQIRSYRTIRLLHRPDSHHIKDKLSKMSDGPGMSHSYIYHMYPSSYLYYVYNKTHQHICYIQHNELLMKGTDTTATLKKGKGIPYSILSIGPGADPNVQTVSLQVTHKSSTRR